MKKRLRDKISKRTMGSSPKLTTMTFEEMLRQLQEDDPSLTAAELQADLDWLVEQGYLARIPEVRDVEAGAYVTQH